MRRVLLIVVLVTFVIISSCGDTRKQNTDEGKINTITTTETQTDSKKEYNSEYKYNYRSGTSNHYEYNYDVVGTDGNGDEVSGNVDMEGKYGTGYIYDENDNEVYIEAEWIDYGELEATDDDGNTYNLEVE